MQLDTFDPHTLVFQITYANAFEIWDEAGSIAREMGKLWGDLELAEGVPQQQVLRGSDVVITTSFSNSIVSLARHKASTNSAAQIRKTLAIWREKLNLSKINRVGTRLIYFRNFDSIADANKYLIAKNYVQWPKEKVFNQPVESDLNALELSLRFQDAESSALLRVKTEQVTFRAELDRTFVDQDVKVEKNRAIIDFDRAVFNVSLDKFNVEEWISGCFHVLRRDLHKVLKD